jgi:hypothetical protein
MSELRPIRYFEATITTLSVASDDSFECHDFTEDEQESIEEALELITELDESFSEEAHRGL